MSELQQGGKRNKQEDLREMIQKFSCELYENLDEFVFLVPRIYDSGFRHSYGDITALLIKLNKEQPDALDNICFNISSLIDRFSEENNYKILKSLNKLYDHIILEQIRLCQVYQESKDLVKTTEMLIGKSEKSVERIEELIEKSEKSVERTRELVASAEAALAESKKMLEEASGLKAEVITVLGIFAAIVMAFTGGIAFSTSVLENMHKASVYRIIMVILGIGFVLVNGIYVLTEFIRSVTKTGNKDRKFIFCLNIGLFLSFILVYMAMKNHWFSQEVFHVVEFVSR